MEIALEKLLAGTGLGIKSRTGGIIIIGRINGSNDDTVYMPKIELAEIGEGIIMKSPDGSRYKLTIVNGGTISITLV